MERNAALEKRKKGIIFRTNAINKKGAKTFRCVARFWSKLNEFNETSRGEREGFGTVFMDFTMTHMIFKHRCHARI